MASASVGFKRVLDSFWFKLRKKEEITSACCVAGGQTVAPPSFHLHLLYGGMAAWAVVASWACARRCPGWRSSWEPPNSMHRGFTRKHTESCSQAAARELFPRLPPSEPGAARRAEHPRTAKRTERACQSWRLLIALEAYTHLHV